MQLTIVNTPIPRELIGKKVFFEPNDERTLGYVDEYNRILNDKLREGVSNLERHRYLTYMVGADDVDAATPKLARIRADVCQTLARIRCRRAPDRPARSACARWIFRRSLWRFHLRGKTAATRFLQKLSGLERIKISVLPSTLDMIRQKPMRSQLREVRIEDLFGP